MNMDEMIAEVDSEDEDEDQSCDSSDSSAAASNEEEQIEQAADLMADNYEQLLYNAEKSADQINYDHYHFSVAQKYDLSTRNLTFKKMKFITDEIFLELRPRTWRYI